MLVMNATDTCSKINCPEFRVSLQQNNLEALSKVSQFDKSTACYAYFLAEEYRKHIWNILNKDFNHTNLATPSNNKYHDSIYKVILTEIIRASLNIDGGAVNYSYNEKMLVCSNVYNLSYYQYTQANWNYLFLVNVINNSFSKSQNLQNINSLLDQTYNVLASNFIGYKSYINKARSDISRYLTDLHLIDMINLCKKYKTEYDKGSNLSNITNLQSIDVKPRKNWINFYETNGTAMISFAQLYSAGLPNNSKYIGLYHTITISADGNFLYQKYFTCSNEDEGTNFTNPNVANEYIAKVKELGKRNELVKFVDMLATDCYNVEYALNSKEFLAIKGKFDVAFTEFVSNIWNALKDIVSYNPNCCLYGIPLGLSVQKTYEVMYYINNYSNPIIEKLRQNIYKNYEEMDEIIAKIEILNESLTNVDDLEEFNKLKIKNETLENKYYSLKDSTCTLKNELTDIKALHTSELCGTALLVKVLNYIKNVIKEVANF